MRIQNDLYSLQAERLMKIIRPHLPDTFAGRLLGGWDCCYDRASRAATLFEEVYQGLLREVFGKGLFGLEAWDEIIESTSIVANFYGLFDNILLNQHPEWFSEEPRDAIIGRVTKGTLTEVDPLAILPWGQRQQIIMTNVFFDGRLPRFLWFDHGPIELPGNRATVVQGGVFFSHDRQTTFTPSWRFITDLGANEAHTALAGGPSGNRFSRWYRTDIKRWQGGTYKKLKAD
jgi:penicillin amidase